MSLFEKFKRFSVKNLFVCKIFCADDLQCKSYYRIAGVYYSLWTPRFLGIKILYGENAVLKDPIYGTNYVAKVDALHPENTLYYNKIGNITDIFNPTIIGKKTKISLTKIEELNTILEVEYNGHTNQRIAT